MPRKTRAVGKNPLHKPARAKAALALRAMMPAPSPEQRQSDAYDKITAGWVHSQWVQYAMQTYNVSQPTASQDFTKAQDAMVADVNMIWPTALEWHIRHRMDLIHRIRSAPNPDRRLELAAVQDLAHLSNLYAQNKAALARAGLDGSLADKAKSGDDQLAQMLLAAYGTQSQTPQTVAAAPQQQKENEE